MQRQREIGKRTYPASLFGVSTCESTSPLEFIVIHSTMIIIIGTVRFESLPLSLLCESMFLIQDRGSYPDQCVLVTTLELQ